VVVVVVLTLSEPPLAEPPILFGGFRPVSGRWEEDSDRVYIHPQTPLFARLYGIQAEVADVPKSLEN
jgi:hypothetical protein